MENTAIKEKKSASKLKRNGKIGFLAFLALTCSMVFTVYEYPMFASSGWAIILYTLLTGLCFFLPIAIVAAEMGTVKRWEKDGIFVWVSQTLGRRWGLAAIFYQWFSTTIGFLGMMFFVSSALGFCFGGVRGFDLLTQSLDDKAPFQLSASDFKSGSVFSDAIKKINENSTAIYHGFSSIEIIGALTGVMILIFVVITLTQLFGVKYTSLVARIGFVSGIVIPSIVLIVLGSIYINNHTSRQILDNIQGQFTNPNTNKSIESINIFTRGNNAMSALSLMIAVVLAFIGVEGSGTLSNNLRRVNRNYPLAVLTLLVVAVTFSVLSGVIIAAATDGTISLTGGVIVAFVQLFIGAGVDPHSAILAGQIMSFFVSFGVIAEVASWVISPAHGLKYAADRKLIPSIFSKTNRFGVPIVNVGVQTLVTISWILIIVLGLGSISGHTFQAGISVTVVVYLFCYFILLIAYIKMKWIVPNLERAFKIKSKWLSLIMAIVCFLLCALAIVISFFNPDTNPETNVAWYSILTILSVFGISLPFIIYEIYLRYQKKHNVDLKQFSILPLKEQYEDDLKNTNVVEVGVNG